MCAHFHCALFSFSHWNRRTINDVCPQGPTDYVESLRLTDFYTHFTSHKNFPYYFDVWSCFYLFFYFFLSLRHETPYCYFLFLYIYIPPFQHIPSQLPKLIVVFKTASICSCLESRWETWFPPLPLQHLSRDAGIQSILLGRLRKGYWKFLRSLLQPISSWETRDSVTFTFFPYVRGHHERHLNGILP